MPHNSQWSYHVQMRIRYSHQIPLFIAFGSGPQFVAGRFANTPAILGKTGWIVSKALTS